MSRSYKKAIIKDRGLKKLYHRSIRRTYKQKIRIYLCSINMQDIEDIVLPSSKILFNDYDYCDYVIDYEHIRSSSYFWYGGDFDTNYWKKLYSRK